MQCFPQTVVLPDSNCYFLALHNFEISVVINLIVIFISETGLQYSMIKAANVHTYVYIIDWFAVEYEAAHVHTFVCIADGFAVQFDKRS